MIPRARRDLPQAAGIELRVEFFAGPGHDDDLVLGVAADVGEAITQLLVGTGAPLQSPAVGMKRNLENAVTPFHADVLILVGVVFELDHSDPSFRRGLKHPQRRFTRGRRAHGSYAVRQLFGESLSRTRKVGYSLPHAEAHLPAHPRDRRKDRKTDLG